MSTKSKNKILILKNSSKTRNIQNGNELEILKSLGCHPTPICGYSSSGLIMLAPENKCNRLENIAVATVFLLFSQFYRSYDLN